MTQKTDPWVAALHPQVSDGATTQPGRPTLVVQGPGAPTVEDDPAGKQTILTFPSSTVVTKTVDSGSATITAGYAAMMKNSKITLATSAALPTGLYQSGIVLSTAAANTDVAIITQGLIDPSTLNLGAGLACAVGTDANGKPVRVTDVTCVSGLKYLGVCDVNGAIYVSPRFEQTYRVEDFGLVAGSSQNDVAARYMIEAIRSRNVGSSIVFGPGDWHFAQPLGPIPGGVSVRGQGHRGAFSANKGTRLIFDGPGPGIFFDLAGTGGNSSHGGFVEHLVFAGNLNTDHTAGLVNTAFNTRIWAGRSPIPTLSGTPGGPHVWEIYIQTSSTFQWSSDGGTTYTYDVPIASSVSLTDGVTVNFPGGTYVAGDNFVAQSVQNINECGVEVIGDVDVNIFGCLSNGFKYQVSFDGCSQCSCVLHNCADGGSDLHGYQSMVTDLGDDSAVGYRCGSWKFTVDGSANGNMIDNVLFNNSRHGVWCQDGVGLIFKNIGSEVAGAMVWLSGGQQIQVENVIGESSTWTIYCHNSDPGGGPIMLSLKNVYSGNCPYPVFADVNVQGCSFDQCTLLQSVGNYAITGAVHFSAVWFPPTNRIRDNTKIADGYCDENYGIIGLAINHTKLPAAGLDVKLLNYGDPVLIHRTTDTEIYSVMGGPTNERDGTIESYDQMISSGSGAVGARAAKSVTRAQLSTAAGAASFGELGIIDTGSAYVVVTVVATRTDDSTKTAYWQIRQGCHREGGTLTLLGSPVTLDTEDLDGAFVAPTIVADATNHRLRVQLTGHPSQPSVWSIYFGGLETGR